MFYPRDPSHLEQLLETFYGSAGEVDGRALGIVSPHAGYIYSGAVAASSFARISSDFAGTFVVIGPSHRGYLTCTSVIPWETPLGIVDIDTQFAQALGIGVDEVSHRSEHSIEVQMPFIKYRFPRARVVPVMMGEQAEASAGRLAGQILAAVRVTGREVRVVASSDFSHYVPDRVARTGDNAAIGALFTLDIPAFYRRIEELSVSACGYGPIAAMCLACRGLGATRAELIRYATSGDVTGDTDQVVGYAAIAVI
jgi:AmmeMemoRadiSam system protein B